ncbi:MAG: LuxR C-terminal-related transcriptional regulator [Anaerolineae bacterium]
MLVLIAAGLNNGEIAERLFISLGMVKRHINHLRQIEAQSRTQAIVRARSLRLLQEN